MTRLALAAGMAAVLAAGCATPEPPPTCPQATLRRAACADGRRLATYDADLAMATYCEPLAPDRRPAPRRRDVPLVELPDGTRALELAGGEWLLLPRERNVGDAPEDLARWWRIGRCVPPARGGS